MKRCRKDYMRRCNLYRIDRYLNSLPVRSEILEKNYTKILFRATYSTTASPWGNMEYRHLGRCGLKVSAISLGSWVTFGNQINEDKAAEIMKVAYDNGINFFDTAESYSQGAAEEVIGKVLKKQGWHRENYVVATKLFWGGEKGPLWGQRS